MIEQKFTKRQLDIIHSAISLLNSGGLAEVTMKNLAASLRVSEPAIYRHFASKADILAGILDHFSAESGAVLEGLGVNLGPLEAVESFFLGRCSFFAASPQFVTLMFASDVFGPDPALSGRIDRIIHSHGSSLAGFVARGQAEGVIRDDIPAHHATMMIMGLMRLTLARWKMSGMTFDLEAEGRELWNSAKKLIASEGRLK